ncbi:carboxylesterase family protein [Agrobacterium vitis]|uniref:Carboxylic ester hydrolase n=1 Tax=Agrobacterium vitis TaxID=373 RepID=A0AAE4X138_AGRVI|nr:carboxylesterase family protein [Agrobacterium vitis]MBF2714102.1 carboxylesterase/lipase family protein [Agrobacterium vitis]MUO81481.1 carboxylesterase family protein [Agrobacterium vitis]MUO95872.1 carboxylesterase family protein [Agrobacterium vitis]MVA93951.1 carboxylesterase family protein [Agrobacterium vitis]MVB03542.1 carboxylesterase family protein [Agrobacterium vitis]
MNYKRTLTSKDLYFATGKTTRCLALTSAILLASVGTDLVAYAASYTSGADAAVVDTRAGEVVGAERNGVYSYLGVQYATAERFMPPKPVTSWEGVRPAVAFGETCPIPAMKSVAGDELFNPHRYLPTSENCLSLNLWTPGLKDGKKRPVMVWLHGGGYTNGSSIEQVAYDGENLARKGDVVVITLNHRLNALGFLDLSAYGPEYKESGNASIADLVAALQWVKDNAEAFGGDPGNVTIFGQSGGGSKVRTLMGLPAAKGLFSKAIVQSGATTTPTTNQKSAQRIAQLTLKNLGLETSQVAQLKTLPVATLIEAGTKALEDAKKEGDPNPRWAPVVDGSYLPRDPVGDGWVDQAKDIPLLIGTVLNEQETVTRFNPAVLFADNKNKWTAEKTSAKLKERFGDKADAVGKAFVEAYPDKKLADAAYVDLTGRPGTLKNIQLKAKQGGAPVYSYVFTRESPAMGGIGGAWHCSEIPYVFANAELVSQATGGGPEAAALQDKMSQAWINFAKSGNPNHPGLPEWPAYAADKGATMIFDNKSEVRFNHDLPLLKAAGVM